MDALKIGLKNFSYDAMIGVGGIGSGMFFLLEGNHTLGREESRSGHFLDKDDYCKLHIISHYVKSLLGEQFEVIPVGKVGNDDAGKKLVDEMKDAGLSTSYVGFDETKHTLFSFCFLYPERSGGNMTTDDSACSAVDADYISNAKKEFVRFAGRGIALAAPEVSLEARIQLLDLATEFKFFRVASFTSGEMEEVMNSGILKKVDLLCINLDEASSALKLNPENADPVSLIKSSVEAFTQTNDKILISITQGKDGSWIWDGSKLSYMPALKVDVVSTAGAGDAFTSGLIAGIVAGLQLKDAQLLATLTGACSVTSPHTINKKLNRKALFEIIKNSNPQFSKNILKLLEE